MSPPANLFSKRILGGNVHFDPEISWFLITFAFLVVVGLPRIRRSVWLPREFQFQDVPSEQLTAAQISFLKPYDDAAAALNFREFKTFRISNLLGHNLIRVYLSSADPAKFVVTMVASKNKELFVSYLEFATMYADGTRLVINNNRSSGLFEDLPGVITHRYKGVKELAELKRRHDEKAESLKSRGIVFYSPENYFEDLQRFHRSYCEHQASKVLLQWDQQSGVYQATSRTALRGIRNFLNPFSDTTFSFVRFVAGLVLGAGLPVTVKAEATWLSTHAGAYGLLLAGLAPWIAYGVAGASVGIFFSRRTFVWALLLALVPNRFIFGGAQMGYSVWMAALADLSGRMHNRRQNVL